MVTTQTKRNRLVNLIRDNPGLDSAGLRAVGWRPQTHGSLRQASLDAVIAWNGDGWIVA